MTILGCSVERRAVRTISPNALEREYGLMGSWVSVSSR
jgi:hypothetical protein